MANAGKPPGRIGNSWGKIDRIRARPVISDFGSCAGQRWRLREKCFSCVFYGFQVYVFYRFVMKICRLSEYRENNIRRPVYLCLAGTINLSQYSFNVISVGCSPDRFGKRNAKSPLIAWNYRYPYPIVGSVFSVGDNMRSLRPGTNGLLALTFKPKGPFFL